MAFDAEAGGAKNQDEGLCSCLTAALVVAARAEVAAGDGDGASAKNC